MNHSNLNVSPAAIAIEDFNYDLPDEKIAKHPLEVRDACKLLVRSHNGEISEHTFSELPSLLPENSMLIYNNTRVINARLRFRKSSANDHQEGALIEIFCLEPVLPADYAQSFASDKSCSWTCFVGNSKRWKEGSLTMEINIGNEHLTLSATRLSREGNASTVEFSWDNHNITFSQLISAIGEIPIPPYLNRSTEASDSQDYQTVYSRIEGSVAAPTAGLHFTDKVLQEISDRGIQRRELTLHVGAGTFQPVKSELIGDHPMHAEFFAVPKSLLTELAQILSQPEPRKQIIAVGTTSVRTLESLYHAGKLILRKEFNGEIPQWTPYESPATSAAVTPTDAIKPAVSVSPAETIKESAAISPAETIKASANVSPAEAIKAIIAHMDETGQQTFIAATRIIIAPGYQYQIVNGMVTNFHQPKSTLLLLVSAFTKGDWRPMYDFALSHSFRFLSYGDASLLL